MKETLKVCADPLHNCEFIPPTIDKALFTEILTASTISVKFSFNNAMHKQIDGVAMGSPVGPALAIFVEYCEEELFRRNSKPSCVSVTLMTPWPP